ncbi:hypothetical protein CC99x_003485 [Candidatus Berkiella cookevillensis]|uniref:Uncharacterized protein n=1 Tax=Candidatus Berkiella cookevillensis TaxID=437022 RepID=A0A0Q9Y9Y1_9GAMM|nr:hypothetical protein [Candidatus Berkiella cookevillensis]MCS5707960.1 hypothetical protein [Candidatus Berkiella cookevillensis]
MKNNKSKILKLLNKELAVSGFDLDNFVAKHFSEKNLTVLESELIKKVSGGRHEKVNADGSKDTTFIKAGPVTY